MPKPHKKQPNVATTQASRTSRKLKPIPRFASEDEERAFWATHDTTDYFDMSNAQWVGPLKKLRPSTTTISLRLPTDLLGDLRELADERDVPYQSLLKIYLRDRVSEEIQHPYRVNRSEEHTSELQSH